MRMSEQINKSGSRLDGAIDQVNDAVRNSGRGLGELAHAIGDEAREGSNRLMDLVRHETDRAVHSVRDIVREKPTLTVGIAAGAGIILGLILASRR